MKSKLNDAELIAEAYGKVEVQEEMLGALAGGIGKVAAGTAKVAGKAVKATGKALTSDVAKKAYKAAGKAALKTGEVALKGTAGAVAGAMGGAVDGIADAVSDEEHEGKEHDNVDTLEAKITKALATGGIDKSDAASIRRMNDVEDAEHEAPVEVDMSQNPEPESLEVTKEVETPCSGDLTEPEAPRVNHHDDSEIKMALSELYKIEKYAFALGLMMKEMPALEGWTAAKITKAADYLGSVFHKLDYDFASGEHATMAPKAEDHEGH